MSSFAAAFKPITAAQAKVAIDKDEKFILFVGRPSCPYCQRFEPKLTHVAKTNQLAICYLNSENYSDLQAIQSLREQYGIKTVPGLLVAENAQVRVICDSSLSEAAILDFIS